MTRDEILKMPACRDMDALVAKGLGFMLRRDGIYSTRADDNSIFGVHWGDGSNDDVDWFNPSGNILPMWHVFEYMQEHGQSVLLDWGEDNGLWECSWITSGERYTGYADIAPLAVCRAFLLAASLE